MTPTHLLVRLMSFGIPLEDLNGRCRIPLPDKRNFEEVPPQHDFEAWETPIFGPWFEEKLHRSSHKWVSRFSLYFRHILLLVFTLPISGFETACPNPPIRSYLCSSFAIRHCRCVKSLELDIAKVDAEYDKCQEAWANGEVDNFTGDKLLGWYMFRNVIAFKYDQW